MLDLTVFPYSNIRESNLARANPNLALKRMNQIEEQMKSFLSIENDRFVIDEKNSLFCLFDNTGETELKNKQYIYHCAWAARVLAQNKPRKHVDISSYIYFNAICSAFVPIDFFDYRPANLTLSSLKCGHVDLLDMSFEDNSIESLSCMHVVEHVGLGRYGEPLDYNGDIKAINELKRVVKKGGIILFVVPIGEQAIIQFNAHRIYRYDQIIELFNGFSLESFSMISDHPDDIDFIENVTEDIANRQKHGCGCFVFKKEVR